MLVGLLVCNRLDSPADVRTRQVQCQECHSVSERKESFFDLPVVVRGFSSLQESLGSEFAHTEVTISSLSLSLSLSLSSWLTKSNNGRKEGMRDCLSIYLSVCLPACPSGLGCRRCPATTNTFVTTASASATRCARKSYARCRPS